MTKKKIFILLGNEDCNTFSGGLANNYEKGAKDAGHEVRRINICDLKFDPLLHKGYKEIQELEPDLVRVQDYIKWADHFVIFYPNWWGSMPAILKGMFDRMFLPGFAFHFRKEGILKSLRWEKLLKGKSAHVCITMNYKPWVARLLFGDNSNEITRNILKFAGFSPVHLVRIGPVEKKNSTEREVFKKRAYKFGQNAK